MVKNSSDSGSIVVKMLQHNEEGDYNVWLPVPRPANVAPFTQSV